MDYTDILDAIKTACAVIGMVVSVVTFIIARQIKTQTDGLTAKLVTAEKEVSRKEGVDEGVAIAANIADGSAAIAEKVEAQGSDRRLPGTRFFGAGGQRDAVDRRE